MRIESMDASAVMTSVSSQRGSDMDSTAYKYDIQPIGEKNNESNIPEKVIAESVEKANKVIASSNRKFEYSVHEQTKAIMIKVINTDTNEVIREIPPKKILDVVANLMELAGLIVDERR